MALQTKTFSIDSNTFTLRLTLTENSTNTTSNTSSVTYKLELISTTKDFYSFNVGADLYIDNRVIASRDRGSSPQINLPVRSSVTLLSGTTTVSHDSQGDKTISIKYSLDMAKTSYTPGALNGSGSMPLTNIPRGATLSNAPNFNDEENPRVEFNNPAKVQVQLGIFKDSTTPLANYRVVSGSPYTFSLTDQERKALRSVDKTKNAAQVRFYIKSTVGGKAFITYLTRTLTIKNPAPTLNPTVEDENPVTLALTGDKNKLVKYHSNAKITIGAQAVKEATISRTSVDCGGKSLSTDGTITEIESGSFLFTAVDSRGNVTSKEVTKSIVAYVKPTAHIGEGTPDGTGTYEFNVSGSCFAGSFGVEDNELTLEYHYKALGSAVWGTWTPMTLTPKGTQYTASVTITGLNYQVKYEFQARITDKLGQSLSEIKVVTSIPGWDWSENDFNFNIEIRYKNKPLFDLIYPVGSIFMSTNNVNPGTLVGGTWVPWGTGRVPVGINTSDTSFNTAEKTGGEKSHTLTVSEIPSHRHRMTHLPYLWVDVDDNASTNPTRLYGWSSGSAATRGGISWQKDETGWYEPIGGGSAHNNMPPYIVCYMWKRTA